MEFQETSEKLTLDDIKAIEADLSINFPEQFTKHYIEHNGGYPTKRHYLWPDGTKTRINHFFSILHEGFTQLEEVYTDLFIIEQILPSGFLPFATDDGGDLFCISTLPSMYNAIFFCDMHHYEAEKIENYFTQLSVSFNDFIENLVD
jgi:cell wall assembly regulator SMI1